ncbi:transglycosylase domain-containing protein [Actinomadura xylanilytica]|uniref:transglycosylase domain-containing protein n=1 Tax=Actinomadura xylanilytica TaxID=887459 RepID=UPI00255AE87F|nr:transglycosylase domain-containing protein [Actinomadura xylanilytica]MDL4773447.1 transglycosylase domain-containing protein [Actinomadura xylanilytica]
MTGVSVLGFTGLATLVGVAYAQTPVPDIGNSDAVKTAAIFYYRDGTEIGRIGKNREPISIQDVPKPVQEAVIAAENRSFRSDNGFSPSGITRAVWNNVSGGDTQGGSTITQQLAKKYYLSDDRTMSRKFKEMFISLKLEDKLGTKDKILELYLNTIFFGRNAYGIQAASRAYYGPKVTVDKLRPDQGALLAAVIQQPGRLDPRSDDKQAQAQTLVRYRYVLDGMRKIGALSQADFDKYSKQLPETAPIGGPVTFGGQRGYMIKRAIKELERKGITEQQIIEKGLKITTTFDPRKMKAAKQAVENTVPGIDPAKLLKKHVRLGLVSVNATNGEVEAIYGGPSYLKQSFDNVWWGSAQAGSAMKPYVLATALEKGYGLKSLVEGRSGVSFDGTGKVVPNGTPGALGPIPNSHAGKGAINLVQATKESTNTAYLQLAMKVGIGDVVKTAEKAGVNPSMVEPFKEQAGLALGINDIRPIEQAAGYAVFANGGTYHQPHVVKAVNNADKQPVKVLSWDHKAGTFSAGVTADVTYALQQVVKPGGTAQAAALPDRPVAGKTGTTDKNVATWFVGYTPKISTAVTMYNEKRKRLNIAGGEVQGGTIPAKIWHAYMAEATKGTPVDQFPQPAWTGSPQKWAEPYKPKKPKDDDGKPAWCKTPIGKYDPRCQDGDDGDGGGKPPCQSPMPDGNCDPNKPPSADPPRWWCQMHRDNPLCRRGGGNGGGGGNNEWPNPQEQQPRKLSSRPVD